MIDIFKKIEGRKWDWFGVDESSWHITEAGLFGVSKFLGSHPTKSVADLLANKSFTDACGLTWKDVKRAFNHLRERGHQACIDYILKTMI